MAKAKTKADALPRVVFATQPVDGVQALWQPNPGPQTEVFLRNEYEILFGGAKGGGKTAAGIMWLLKGNPDRINADDRQPADISYINHPHYRALVLRKNYTDMEYWIGEAKKIYSVFGAKYTEGAFEFPSGAKIVLGHLAEENVWEKYAGNQFQRGLIEEATQIPSLRLYSMVKGNCRSAFKELRAQILLTANPGGSGHLWVSKRFLTTRPDTYKKTLRERITDPVTGREMFVTRTFIPSKIADNPKILETDPTYAARLYSDYAHDENLRRALLDGDWTALSGQYFTNWRPNGPMQSEAESYPWARHVIEPIHLAPSWPRWIGVDWGYKHHSVALWACQLPNKQVHIYRELLRAQMGPEELGVEIALASLKDLEGLEENSLTVWLSPDAFAQRQDERTIADQIAVGIRQVLGPTAAYVAAPGDFSDDPEQNGKDFFETRELQQRAGIVLRRAQNHRVAGWQYVHSLMRFKPLVRPSETAFDHEYAQKLALELGAQEYFKYVGSFQAEREALPILQVHNTCKSVIEAIPTAMHWEDKNPEDVMKTSEKEDDVLDTLRYLCMGHKAQQVKAPLAEFVRTRLSQIAESHHGNLTGSERMWAAAKAEQDWGGAALTTGFNVPRIRGRSRVN
jgi:hypothetical protein